MDFIYIKQIINSSNKGTFYVVKMAWVDNDQNIIAKSVPMFWLKSKEVYDKFNAKEVNN